MSPEQHAERRSRIGGSDAAAIVNGDWLQLFLIKTNRAEPEDLTWILPVQLGLVTEELNLAWFAHETGHPIFGRGEVYRHPDHQYLGTTIDGLTLIEGKPAIVQCKHVNAFAKIEEVERRYYPQVTHEMLCVGASLGFLSVFIGTHRHEIVEIRRDEAYTTAYLGLCAAFWDCVIKDIQPPVAEPLATPTRPTTYRTQDFTGNNAWTANAGDWLETLVAAKKNDKAAKTLRGLVEADVEEAFGAGIKITRGKDGRLYLREDPNGPTS